MKAETAAPAKEFGHLAKALAKHSSTLNISARVESRGGPDSIDDNSWRKKEAKRLRKEIKDAEKLVKGWDAEEASAKALKSLKADIAVKRARLMESEALIGDTEDDEE